MTITRKMAQALIDDYPASGWSVEAWNRINGEPTMAALDQLGLVRRHPHWTGCLIRSELGDQLSERLRRTTDRGFDVWNRFGPTDGNWLPNNAWQPLAAELDAMLAAA